MRTNGRVTPGLHDEEVAAVGDDETRHEGSIAASTMRDSTSAADAS